MIKAQHGSPSLSNKHDYWFSSMQRHLPPPWCAPSACLCLSGISRNPRKRCPTRFSKAQIKATDAFQRVLPKGHEKVTNKNVTSNKVFVLWPWRAQRQERKKEREREREGETERETERDRERGGGGAGAGFIRSTCTHAPNLVTFFPLTEPPLPDPTLTLPNNQDLRPKWIELLDICKISRVVDRGLCEDGGGGGGS